MAGMLTRLPLPLLPAGAAEIAPGVGLVVGEDGGGLVSVHGLATFAWDAGDEAGRLLAERGVRTVFVSLPDLTGPEDVLRLAPVAAAFA